MKKILSVILVLSLILAMSLSATAAVADYGDEEDTPAPTVAGEAAPGAAVPAASSTGSAPVVGGSAQAPAAYIPPSFVDSLLPVSVPGGASAAATVSDSVVGAGGSPQSASNAAAASSAVMAQFGAAATAGTQAAFAAAPSVVFVTPDAAMPAAAVANIAQAAAPIVFVAPSYSIGISPTTVTQARDLSLNLGLLATSNSLQLRPAMSGAFGLTMTLAIAIPDGLTFRAPRLYYIPDSGPAQDFGPVTVVGRTVVFSINRASGYIIADSLSGAVAGTAVPGDINLNPPTGAAV